MTQRVDQPRASSHHQRRQCGGILLMNTESESEKSFLFFSHFCKNKFHQLLDNQRTRQSEGLLYSEGIVIGQSPSLSATLTSPLGLGFVEAPSISALAFSTYSPFIPLTPTQSFPCLSFGLHLSVFFLTSDSPQPAHLTFLSHFKTTKPNQANSSPCLPRRPTSLRRRRALLMIR